MYFTKNKHLSTDIIYLKVFCNKLKKNVLLVIPGIPQTAILDKNRNGCIENTKLRNQTEIQNKRKE